MLVLRKDESVWLYTYHKKFADHFGVSFQNSMFDFMISVKLVLLVLGEFSRCFQGESLIEAVKLFVHSYMTKALSSCSYKLPQFHKVIFCSLMKSSMSLNHWAHTEDRLSKDIVRFPLQKGNDQNQSVKVMLMFYL